MFLVVVVVPFQFIIRILLPIMSDCVEDGIQNTIVSEVLKIYDSLGKSGKPKEGEEWTCLAGFVVERQSKFNVVSMATGTKCIGGNSMVFDGSLVHDSHAEVMARRNLLRYIHCQIHLAKENSCSSIFEKVEGLYVLKNGVQFHFYASQVPCGDASIIPMEDNSKLENKSVSDGPDEPSAKRLKTDVHRTGAKPVKTDPRQDPKMDGIDYHVRGAVRIKPGRGDPTKSLSCSDKISKWLFCGLQGALVSLLVPNPIQLSTIVIGGGVPYDADVLTGALCARSGLTKRPRVFKSAVTFKHSPNAAGAVRPCASSIGWADVPGKKLEVSVEGRRLGVTKANKGKSRLLVSKFELFKEFIKLSDDKMTYKEMTYHAVKMLLSTGYQSRKKQFVSAMGSWSEDKSAYDNFRVDVN